MFQWIKNMFSRESGDDYPVWRRLNKQSRDELIDYLLTTVGELEELSEALMDEVGDLSTRCDKCSGYDGSKCFKCTGTGVIKRKQLFEWRF